MLTTAPRGTKDILPEEVPGWRYMEQVARQLCCEYGYAEIRTPIFEHTELFQRGVGETTDIVEKEMYTFTDRGDRSITLRPEGTAAAVRAFVEHKIFAQPQPTKLYYIGPMFRYDRPQAGRFRQFHQFGVEVFGTDHPSVDAEVIAMAMDFYSRLGIKGLEVQINSVGCPECRPNYQVRIRDYLREKLAELCPNCQSRYERNPLRILDCKSPVCKEISTGVPVITGSLCDDCARHFASVRKYLDTLGVAYQVNERLVRGLDYYTKTAFEIVAWEIGAQSSIGGGGRYNGLIEDCGGPPMPGIGYAVGLERVLITLEKQGIKLNTGEELDVFVAVTDHGQDVFAMKILMDLRQYGIAADKDYLERSLKAQMKYAGKKGVKFVVFAGGEEAARGSVTVKAMDTGIQEEVAVDDLISYLQARLDG